MREPVTLGLETPVGRLDVTLSPAGVHRIGFAGEAPDGPVPAAVAPLWTELRKQVKEYFEGRRGTFDLPLAPAPQGCGFFFLTRRRRGGFPQAALNESRGILNFQFFIRDRYLPYVSSYKQSWQTDETILRVHAFPVIGRLRLDEIEANHGSALIKSMRDQDYAVGTINRVIVIVRYALNLARKWGLLKAATNPMSGLSAGPDVLRNRFLSEDEKNRLIKELAVDQNRIAADAILLLLLTGARRNEITHATWDQVDFVKKTLYVPRSKSGKSRWISLNSAAIALLTRRFDPSEKYIFPSPVTGKPSPSLYFPWDRIRNKARLDGVRLHDLRHSFASVLVNQGVSLYVVQGLLGHANPRTAQRYAHLAQDTLTKASEVVADAVRPHIADASGLSADHSQKSSPPP
jgi:integrase